MVKQVFFDFTKFALENPVERGSYNEELQRVFKKEVSECTELEDDVFDVHAGYDICDDEEEVIKMCISPFHLKDASGTVWQTVPCGQCLECRIARTRDWKYRMKFELTSWSSASFVTLTYDDNHLPKDKSLIKTDLQKFFKRLRFQFTEKYGKDCRIKYFACGEYGDRFGRPHYHAIIFGVHPERDRALIQSCWKYCQWHKLSHKSIGNVTDDSINYVAGYIQKKQLGKANTEKYEKLGLLPPFQLCSQGLGLKFLLEHQDMFRQDGCIRDKGRNIPLPRYYKKKWTSKIQKVIKSLLKKCESITRKNGTI